MARALASDLSLSVLLAVALVLVLVAAQPGAASKHPEPIITTPSRFPPILDCGPAPVAAAPAGESDGGAFRANLLSLLRIVPSAAAADPAGFVAGSLGATDRDRAFARALCFGGANRSSSSAAAARDATEGCGASRRAGVWRAGYADTDALSAREDAFRGWFYAGANTTALKDGVYAGDLTGAEAEAEADCARCFEDAKRAAAVQTSVLPMMDHRRFSLFSWLMWTTFAEAGIVIALFLLIITTLGGDNIPQPIP